MCNINDHSSWFTLTRTISNNTLSVFSKCDMHAISLLLENVR